MDTMHLEWLDSVDYWYSAWISSCKRWCWRQARLFQTKHPRNECRSGRSGRYWFIKLGLHPHIALLDLFYASVSPSVTASVRWFVGFYIYLDVINPRIIRWGQRMPRDNLTQRTDSLTGGGTGFGTNGRTQPATLINLRQT